MSNVELESKTQKAAMNLLRHNKAYVYKNAQGLYTERGRPDLVACVPIKISQLKQLYQDDDTVGLFMGIEMKRPGEINNTSIAQEIVGRQIQNCGGIWFPLDNIDNLKHILQKLLGDDYAI